MTRTGAELIAAERQRQTEVKGWTSTHDDEHFSGALAMAACCYAAPKTIYVRRETPISIEFTDPWPWDQKYDKRFKYGGWRPGEEPKERRLKSLVKAGALIAAEIDRLQRLVDKETAEAEAE